MMKPYNCEVCGDNYSHNPRREVMRFCSKQCQRKYHGNVKMHKDSVIIKKFCVECGGSIDNPVLQRKYCSSKCSLIAQDKRKSGDKFLIFHRDGFRCIYCGRGPSQKAVILVCDHIVPKTKGGEDSAGNLVTSCTSCNASKSNKRLWFESNLLNEINERNSLRNIPPHKYIKGSHCKRLTK